MDAEEAALRGTVSVNVMAPLVLLHRLLRGMLARRGGWATGRGNRYLERNGILPGAAAGDLRCAENIQLFLAEALTAELDGAPIDLLVLCPPVTMSNVAERSGYGPNLPGAQHPFKAGAQHCRRWGGSGLWP
ncbi:hypothetical protein ACFQU2_19935 [Siccirubricoccus deserti]|uniref:SDR family NAD(P)-dependent oxidoreductase n=1 Tax=Siccirubricoccus deserti TaxID=2013562 RepID=A0A9X0R2Q4_9PROT|nr:hypothetical protein [Siccirubricoccus deserti]MBC4018500.1 hypothetical protein [Siccirubricoccus deserti]